MTVTELAALKLTGYQHAEAEGGYLFVDDVDGRLAFAARSGCVYLDQEQEDELRAVLASRYTAAGKPDITQEEDVPR